MEQATTGVVLFHFDLLVHSMYVIKTTALRYSGHYHVAIESNGASRVSVILRPRDSSPLHPLDARQFDADVLEQELRERVALETKSVRELLLAQAFSAMALVDPETETSDFRDDPLGIGGPNRKVRTEGKAHP
ncbi:MAG: hypothetical protein SGI77_06430 [Pirellulaceae bacterium]|nr:hypothetical protein [Pirellulaceae bacterium]